MPQEPSDVEWLSVTGDLIRDVAHHCFLGSEAQGSGSELVVVASGVQRVDAVTGTAARLRVARHLRKHPDGTVDITLPSRAGVAERFLDLLTPLPGQVAADRVLAPHGRTRYALVPATAVADDTDAVAAAAFALEACDRARISDVRANLVAWAVMELASNALVHAEGATEPPVVAVTVAGRERKLEVAVSDFGLGISGATDPRDGPDVSQSTLKAIPGVRGGLGGLAEFIRRGRARQIDVSLEIIAGTGRLRWTAMRHRTSTALWVPGTTVVASVRS